ncbi:MAG: TetR/AcrR family transcriptional regulator [Pseudomonadota bacterium]
MEKDEAESDKKTLILDAATIVLTQKGLQSFSFESVANEAGLSRQLIRHYFANTEELITELCDYLTKGYQDVLVTGIVEVSQVERLNFFLDFFFGVDEDHPMPDNLEAYDGLFAYAVGSSSVKKRLWAKYETLGQVMKHELAIAHPQLSGPATEELSFMFVSMMHAHWSYVATLGYSTEHNRLARKAFDRLIESYVRESPTAPSMEGPWSRDR